MDKFKEEMCCGCSDLEKSATVKMVTCKKYGRTFQTDRKTDICSDCEI